MELHEKDEIEVVSGKVGQVNRTGTVRRVLEGDPTRYEVEWDDGHTSLFVPSGGNVRVRESPR